MGPAWAILIIAIRVALLAIAYAGALLLTPNPGEPHSFPRAAWVLLCDALNYQDIARHWYADPHNTAFFSVSLGESGAYRSWAQPHRSRPDHL